MCSPNGKAFIGAAVGEVDQLIEKYKNELAAHRSGEMMSMAEAVHGEKWCEIILADLQKLKESTSG